MITILVGRDGRPSMKTVFAKMVSTANLVVRRNLKSGKGYLRIYSDANVESYKKSPKNELSLAGKKVIRWGNRIEAPTSKNTIVYNKSEAIANGSNKKLAREIFAREKVRCPRLLDDTLAESTFVDSIFPIIARPSTHAKGKNFVTLNSYNDFITHYRKYAPKGWYYSEFINKEREFRVHCAHGKVLSVMEKTRGTDSIAWNRAVTGEPFTKVLQANYHFSVCFQALKAVQKLGLDFAGVDVLLFKDKAYVLEVNTSPTLNSSEVVSAQYAKYFDWLNRCDKRREHWDFTKFKNASSFAWKQFQLTDQTTIQA